MSEARVLVVDDEKSMRDLLAITLQKAGYDGAVAAVGHRARQFLVTDEGRAFGEEGGVPENVIGMHMRIDDEANRLCRHGADRGEKTRAFARACTHKEP